MQLPDNHKYNFVLCAPETAPFISLDANPLVFEKELIYEGQFTKKDANGEVKFGVDGNTLVHFKHTVDTMLANNVEIPMPLEHTSNPESKRANLIGARVGKNRQDKLALFGKVSFQDAEAAKLAKSSDVSIFVAPEHTDGLGNVYKRPIRHVAFTNYPVIPGLEKFEAIACSYDPTDDNYVGEFTFSDDDFGEGLALASPLLPIAQQIGIQQPDTLDEAQLTAAIVAAFNALKMQCQQQQPGQQRPMQPQMPGQMPGQPPMMQPAPPQMAKPFGAHSNMLAKLLKENRETKLDGLVLSGHITKASRDELAKQFCSDAGLGLALSSPTGDDSIFESVLAAAKLNKAVVYDERTGAQLPNAMALSNPLRDDTPNPLLQSAEKRAKEFSDV
jgi:hypothetical protein